MVADNLKRKVTVGSTWLVVARLLARGLDFVALLVLARFLVPEDFGIVAIATALMAVVEAMTDLSVTSALVRLPSITRQYLNTAFTLNALRGLAIFVVMILSAFPLAAFYEDSRLAEIIILLSAAPLMRSLQSPALAVSDKNFSFGKRFVLDVGARLGAAAVSIAYVWYDATYIAIVVGAMSAPLFGFAISYFVAPYLPRFSLVKVSELWDFIGWMSFAQVMSALSWQFDRFFLGRVVPMSQLGLYNVANNISSMPEQVLTSAGLKPLLSGFSALGDDKARWRQAYSQAAGFLFFLGGAGLVVLALHADAVCELLFADKWQGLAPVIQGLCIAFVFTFHRIPFRALIMALGHSKTYAISTTTALVLRVLSVVTGFQIAGIFGVIFGLGISSILMNMVFAHILNRVIALPYVDQAWLFCRFMLACVPMVAFRIVTVPLFEELGGIALLLATVVSAGACLVIFLACTFTVWAMTGRKAGFESHLVEVGGIAATRNMSRFKRKAA